MDNLPLASQTLFADLFQRVLDAEFDDEFDARGLFKRRNRSNRYFWYFKPPGRGARERYVGPGTDTAITDRVQRFKALKNDFKERQTLVRALIAAGLPAPDPLAGLIVEAMWQAGFFRLRGVLIGTAAFQCYAGLLAMKLGRGVLQTQDVDFAQFWGIAQNIDNEMRPVEEVLAGVDLSFRAVPTLDDPLLSARYRNDQRYVVDMLTPNRGSDAHTGQIAKMKALGRTGAQPTRHLDYLIHEPERSALLFGRGVPVTVPRAERFAIHKLIVAVERKDAVKSAKDISQSATLIPFLARQRPHDLPAAFVDAWDRGPRWRDKLEDGLDRLDDETREIIAAAMKRWRSGRGGRGWHPAQALPGWLT